MPAARHRWDKLRIHVYMCRVCGTGRKNEQRPNGQWFTRFYLPSGARVVGGAVPPCKPGRDTAKRLAHYKGAQPEPGWRG
jgi:hypothetical protein